MAKLCTIIAPRQGQMLGISQEDYLAECILKGIHKWGPHVVRTPEGKVVAWEYDYECDCCEPETDQRCTVYWDIREEDIPLYQKGGPPKKK